MCVEQSSDERVTRTDLTTRTHHREVAREGAITAREVGFVATQPPLEESVELLDLRSDGGTRFAPAHDAAIIPNPAKAA
jgi:hypothetical protein